VDDIRNGPTAGRPSPPRCASASTGGWTESDWVDAQIDIIDSAGPGGVCVNPGRTVRLVWIGVPVVSPSTHVRCVPDGISHLDRVWDDLQLPWLYTRLTLGMLAGAPALLRRRAAGRMPD